MPKVYEQMLEDFRNGNIPQLEAGKILSLKLLTDIKNFETKIKLIDKEHENRKKILTEEINKIQISLNNKALELENNERDYWETVIAEISRTIKNINDFSINSDEE